MSESTIEVFSDFIGPMPCPVCETLVIRAQGADGSNVDLVTAAPRILKTRQCPDGCQHTILTIPLASVHLCPAPEVPLPTECGVTPEEVLA